MPYPASEAVDLAVGWLAVLVLMFGPLSAFAVIASASRSEWEVVVRAMLMLAVSVGLAALALALRMRRPWSRTVMVVLLSVVFAGSILGAVAPLLWPPENGHGMMYVVMGAAMWAVFTGALLVMFVRRARPECFRPVPGGWLPDPLRPGGLRLWDGRQWTEQVAPPLSNAGLPPG